VIHHQVLQVGVGEHQPQQIRHGGREAEQAREQRGLGLVPRHDVPGPVE
jgi:hypothetical protein